MRIFEMLSKSIVLEGFCDNVAVSRSETLLLKIWTAIYILEEFFEMQKNSFLRTHKQPTVIGAINQ